MPTVGHEPPGRRRPCCRQLAVDVDQDGAGPHRGQPLPAATGSARGDPVHVRDVDDQAGAGRVGGVAMAARTRRHLHVGVPGEGDAALDIAGRSALGDRGRLLRVDGVVEVTCCGVSTVGGEEQCSGERCGKLRPIGSAVLCGGCGGTAAACDMVTRARTPGRSRAGDHSGSDQGGPAQKGAAVHQIRAVSATRPADRAMVAEVRSRHVHAEGGTALPLAVRVTSTLPRVALE